MRNPRRGDVFYADLTGIEQSIGSEQTGWRPVLVVQNNVGNEYSPTTIVACMTTKCKRENPTQLPFRDYNILPQASVICTNQFKTIDKSRLKDFQGNVGRVVMKKVDRAIAASVGIDQPDELEDIEQVKIMKQDKPHPLMAKKETVLDQCEHDWIKMAEAQLSFFMNVQQYMSNLQWQRNELEQEIETLLDYIEGTNYNAAQGYKVYRMLRERRIRRKQIVKEIAELDALLENFNCEAKKIEKPSCLRSGRRADLHSSS